MAFDRAARRHSYYRHALVVRITHWVNALALAILLMSGLNIFNAHPSLSWDKSSYSRRAPVFETSAAMAADGRIIGVTRIFNHAFVTTGVLGLSQDAGRPVARGFPSWITIPSTTAVVMAAPAPCTNRATISMAWLPGRPHHSEAAVNTASPATNIRLRPALRR